jgi:hypothetical protein
MTPATIRTISDLRSKFYALFIAAMGVPVKISGNSYNSTSLIASWIDETQRLNYVTLYACLAPDELHTQRPFILRLAVNRGAGAIATTRRGTPCRGLNQEWHFELTVLPEEVLDFLPWLIGLIDAKTRSLLATLPEPPHPITFNESDASEAWTQKAKQAVFSHNQYQPREMAIELSI